MKKVFVSFFILILISFSIMVGVYLHNRSMCAEKLKNSKCGIHGWCSCSFLNLSCRPEIFFPDVFCGSQECEEEVSKDVDTAVKCAKEEGLL